MSNFYIVATPIGNLEDITLRALRVLKEVDFIICEDTRVTSKLLARYEIKKPLVSYFQHSQLSRVDEIIARLRRGENAALVTDAGTPGISDPGGVLIRQINQLTNQLINIVPIPGPSALTAALSISGFPTDKFLFLGFPPHKKGRQKFWQRVAESEETTVFYESPHRILKSLNELKNNLITQSHNNPIVVCRELTKMFESIYRGTMEEVLEKAQRDPIKGEYVVVIGK
ncbi:16S rRNA (cytidine(1402)-2'-O)-methyltransferase [Candidatus Uhrbacteria bacterium]|nr:16S rRNA (cytidine(1402)-2'-O)-methyltransferase [Candidatus Uhrbacteria bacterium]